MDFVLFRGKSWKGGCEAILLISGNYISHFAAGQSLIVLNTIVKYKNSAVHQKKYTKIRYQIASNEVRFLHQSGESTQACSAIFDGETGL